MSQPAPPAKLHPDRYVKHILLGFALLVLTWVGLQTHVLRKEATRTRAVMSVYWPTAQSILMDISNGEIDKLYNDASPAYQTVISKQQHDRQFSRIAINAGKLKSWRSVQTYTLSYADGMRTTIKCRAKWEEGSGMLTLLLLTPKGSTEPKLEEIQIDNPNFKL